MTDNVKLSRRSLLKAGAAAGAATMVGGAAWAQERVFVPYSNKSLDYYFFVIQEEAVKRAVEANAWEFQATNANFDNTQQLAHWDSLLLRNPKAIVCDPIDSQAINSAIKRYNQRNIPVGIIDTPAAPGSDVAITVSFDNFIGGQTAAQEIIKRLEAKYGEPRGTVLNCFGALQSVAWRLRKEGMDAEFAKYPNINYLARPTEGALDQMLSVTLSTLSEFPDLDAVHAPSDSPSRGIVTALKQKDRWKKIGEEGHVIFVNIDGEPVALNWIKEGYMDACVSQDPIAYGEVAVEMLQNYAMKGEPVPLGTYENAKYFWEKAEIVAGTNGPTMIIPPFIIDPSNADDKRHWGYVSETEWGIPYT